MKRALLLAGFTLLTATLMGGWRPAEARRNNIDAVQWFTVCQNQALSTSEVTPTFQVPFSKTEAVVAAIYVSGLGPTDTVTLTRLERINSDETVFGYPIPCQTQKEIVIDSTTAGPMTWQIPISEGCEYFQFKAKASAGTPKLTILVGTQ